MMGHRLLVVVTLLLLCVTLSISGHPQPKRLDRLMSQTHSIPFHSALKQYAHHLGHSADVMLLQADSVERHLTEHDEGADGDMATEMDTDAAGMAEAEQMILSSFVRGDAPYVVQLLEQFEGVQLNDHQRDRLVNEIQETMIQVGQAVEHHEPIDQLQLLGALHSLLQLDAADEPTPDWMAELLQKAHTDLDAGKGSIMSNLTAAAVSHAHKHDPEVKQLAKVAETPDWMNQILAGAIKAIDTNNQSSSLHKSLHAAAERHAIYHPTAKSTNDLAVELLGNLDEDDIEAHLRVEYRKRTFKDMVNKNKAKCLRKMRRGQACDPLKFIAKVQAGVEQIKAGKVPDVLQDLRAKPLEASEQLGITRGVNTPPETVRDLEASISNNIDPWYTLPGRSRKELNIKAKTVKDLLDAEGERCPKACSQHGQCIMDMNRTTKSPSGVQNVHPFHCLCDSGYVGNACQIKLDMHLRWLLTEGAAPFPKCCQVCKNQREVPEKWDDIPTYNNPFSSFEPQCQPYPRISAYSREDGSHELIKGRRPHPKCSHPLGQITQEDPIIALELASDLSVAQEILSSSLLEDMDYMSENAANQFKLTHEQRVNHVARLRHGARALKEASETAKKAAQALALKLHITDLDAVEYGSIDLEQLLNDYRELPNDMEECCLFCQLDEEPPLLTKNADAAAAVGPNAILLKDPRLDNTVDARNRRYAQKRLDKRHAKLTGTVPESEQDCCVVCPYNFREIERLNEAAHVRRTKGIEMDDYKEEMDRVFLETFAEIEAAKDDRRRRHEPRPCCPACPSQFLIAHAFPDGPYKTTRTLPNLGPE